MIGCREKFGASPSGMLRQSSANRSRICVDHDENVGAPVPKGNVLVPELIAPWTVCHCVDVGVQNARALQN